MTPARERPPRDFDLRILEDWEINLLLGACEETRYPTRNRLVVLLNAHAGLAAREIAAVKRGHVIDPSDGNPDAALEVWHGRGRHLLTRTIPIPRGSKLFRAIYAVIGQVPGRASDPLILSERALNNAGEGTEGAVFARHMRPTSIAYLFWKLYRAAGLRGSSHIGRQTFIVRAGRRIRETRGTLRDVQALAGHRSLETTQRYVERDEEAQRVVMRTLFDAPVFDAPDRSLRREGRRRTRNVR